MPVVLGFSFPFFGRSCDTVWMHINGNLQLSGDQLPWPYMEEPELLFRSSRVISPVDFNHFTIVASDGDGGWAEITDSCATFLWQLSLSSNPGMSEVHFATRLWHNGNIEFFYGPSTMEGKRWLSGISAGNNKDFIMAPSSGSNKFLPECPSASFIFLLLIRWNCQKQVFYPEFPVPAIR
jgi:hypothetical protein